MSRQKERPLMSRAAVQRGVSLGRDRVKSLSLMLASLCLCAAAVGSSSAQTSFPMITHTHPVAVQRGKTTEVTVDGQQNFHATYKALFEGSGIVAEVATPFKPAPPGQRPVVKSIKLKLTVAPDAALGVREFRLASALGVSSVG